MAKAPAVDRPAPEPDPVVVPSEKEAKPSAADLLVWYDRHRRDLPWRARPGDVADPYRVWLSEIMLQQTTIAAVRPYFGAFLARFPTLQALAEAPSEAVMSAWAGLGYYSRARNLHACAQAVVAGHGGHFPDTEEGLRTLPGIGAYTAAAIAAIAFGRPAAAVDGNVERVVSRLFRVDEPLPAAKPSIRALTQELVPADRPGDFAQAVMDLGSTICTPKRPACALCPWMRPCQARQAGLQESYPVKAPKREGLLRRGAAFVAVRPDGAILLRTRPPKGLLGGMAEVPTSEWRGDYDPAKAILDAPFEARWRRATGVVRHVFTHFPLELAVFVGRAEGSEAAPEGSRWTPRAELGGEPLPNVMKKVLSLALGELPAEKAKGARAKRAASRA
jgi:A/G-specific adenine glycosylase